MAQLWKDEEFAVTDEVYQAAIEAKRNGKTILRSDVFRDCCARLPNREKGSINAHLGNLTAARAELSLDTLDEIAPFANRPVKLIKFLKLKYKLIR